MEINKRSKEVIKEICIGGVIIAAYIGTIAAGVAAVEDLSNQDRTKVAECLAQGGVPAMQKREPMIGMPIVPFETMIYAQRVCLPAGTQIDEHLYPIPGK